MQSQPLLNPSTQTQQMDQQYEFTTFSQCLKIANKSGKYKLKLLLLMTGYWIIASMFIFIPFYLFKKPIYKDCSSQHDKQCIQRICLNHADDIINFITKQSTLTVQFNLFCGLQWLRVVLKVLPQTLPIIGFLIYGSLADRKGRLIAFKISWRFFTIGLLIFSTTQAPFLVIFGYLIACINCYPSLIVLVILLFEQCDQKTRLRACFILLSSLFVGPLILSLLADTILQKIGIRWTITILCSIPAFILAIFCDNMHQSPLYHYKNDKVRAFNIINLITRINQQAPIMIDLGKSVWLNHHQLKHYWFSFFLEKRTRKKVFLGIFFNFIVYYNIKTAQTDLDDYTNSHSRIVLMSLATCLADLTLCFIILGISRSIKKFAFGLIIFLGIRVVTHFTLKDDIQQYIMIAICLIQRYLSQICYGILLIWAIETFPTVCRGRCSGLVLSGCSLGCIAVYIMRQNWLLLAVSQFVITVSLVFAHKLLNLQKRSRLADTLDDQTFDKNDKFYNYISN